MQKIMGDDIMSGNRVSKLVSNISPSQTLAVDAKAKELKQLGEPVIGFGAGEPDFPSPDHVVQAAVIAAQDSKNHKYTPTQGMPSLIKAIVEKTNRDSDLSFQPSEILVTNGGKHAVANTCITLLDPGDEVLLPSPYWTTYPEAIRLSGAVPVEVPTSEENGFHVEVTQLEELITSNTKAILINSPTNPTGAVLTAEELTSIGQFALSNNLWVITDEIYEHLTFDGIEQYSILKLVPELKNTCIILNGVAKTYAMTGWRVGWMIGPKDIIDSATTFQSQFTSNVSNVSQKAAEAALLGSLDYVHLMKNSFLKRRNIITEMLNEIPGVTCNLPEGAFYAFPSLKGILGKEIRGRVNQSTLELADFVLDEAKVAFVPGEAFGAPGYGRFSYALSDDDLVEGISRIKALFAEEN